MLVGPPPGLLMPSLSLVGDIPSNGKNRVMTTAQILGVPVPGVERQGAETQGPRAGSSVPPSGQCRGPHRPPTKLAESRQSKSLPQGEPSHGNCC